MVHKDNVGEREMIEITPNVSPALTTLPPPLDMSEIMPLESSREVQGNIGGPVRSEPQEEPGGADQEGGGDRG